MKRQGQVEGMVLPLGPTSTRLVQPDTAYWSIHNFVPTDEGGFISVRTPLPLVPDAAGGPPPSTDGAADTSPLTYGATYGVFHARLRGGERDVLLLHTDDQLWVFQGWDRAWRCLVGPSSSSPIYTDEIPIPTASEYRTQFVATPTGIVIVPQHGRAYFYDGTRVLPLGYDKVPAAPVGWGPESTASTWFPDNSINYIGVNDTGYAVDGLWPKSLFGSPVSQTALDPYFRYGRIGTVTVPSSVPSIDEDEEVQVAGYLEAGRWRGRTRWIDCWGNLSAWSADSNDIRIARQPAMIQNISALPTDMRWCQTELVRKQFAWVGISKGPTGTIGRDIARTRDLMNSGDVSFYVLPRDASGNASAFATLPDNICSFYPDNIPDSWLVNKIDEVMPVPMFKLAAMCFGRMFIANFRDSPGAVAWSYVGRWGTYGKDDLLFPDPQGAEVTGLHRVDGGLLLFTETGTYLLTPNDSGDGFRSSTVSANVGCVAPSSIDTLRNGVTIWLGRDGFYGYTGGEPSFLFESHRYHSKRFNRAVYHRSAGKFDPRSGQYRCWVPYENGLQSDMCFCYDGTAWHTRDDIKASSVTVTNDHRRLCIASGIVDGEDGVWVMDHGGPASTADIRTAWLRNQRSQNRASVRFVWLWLRETGSYTGTARIAVDVLRDYRVEVESTSYAQVTPEESADGPANADLWGTATFGSATWRTRRPFWCRVDIDVPTCEVFQLRISCDGEYEILGLSFDEMPRDTSGATAYGV